MNREGLKKLLIEKGVDPRLTEMPAIMEPLLAEVTYTNPVALKEKDFIQVRDDGTYKLAKRIVSFNADGTVTIRPEKITYGEDYDITVNQEGIEVSYSDGNDLFIATSVIRKDGVIDDVFMNNGNGSYSSTKYFDNGHWSIKQAAGYKMRDNDDLQYEFDEEKVRGIFEETSREVTLNYPNTVSWYKKTAQELESRIAEEKDPIKRKKLSIQVLKMKKRNLEHTVSHYTDRIEERLEKLGESLDCIEEVKKDPLGKRVFAKSLDEYNETAKKFTVPDEEEKKAEEGLKIERERQNNKEKSKESTQKNPESLEALEEEEQNLLDRVKVLGLQNEYLKLRYKRLGNMQSYAEGFIGKVKKSLVGQKVLVVKALKDFRANRKAKKIEEKERE